VQTLKRSHDGALARFEHEVALGGAAASPAPDLSRHAGIDDGDAALAVLAAAGGMLVPLFDVDVRRTSRRLRHGGATIELAFDEGAIHAGEAREALCELELELVTGPLDALGALASRFALRHGLWLDVRSKAERGYRLAGATAAAPPSWATPTLNDDDAAPAVVRACMRAALAQLLPCTSALAAGEEDAERVHQARVALRRLLSVWREFGDMASAVDASWIDAAHTLFQRLGAARDRDIVDTVWRPRLLAAGAPLSASAAPLDGAPNPAAACRDPTTSAALIAWLVHAQGTDAPSDGHPDDDAMAAMRARLGRLHRRLRRAGRSFDALSDEQRHRARRRLKRLRYCAEALSSLFPRRAWTRYLQRLKIAQDALGRLQDWTLAQQHFAACEPADALVWFARGWLAAQRDACITDAGRALAAIGQRPRFLR
jgi:inorganic triphosphatase YgiF